ncbi:coiled-coil domain-containing protein 150-like [Watersipora subatra]|uniref:coiled-coil domain-containing protein 150-like n=1 Tax=Watersipora subatra TaxID=2589382 RepID=UPI00355C302F
MYNLNSKLLAPTDVEPITLSYLLTGKAHMMTAPEENSKLKLPAVSFMSMVLPNKDDQLQQVERSANKLTTRRSGLMGETEPPDICRRSVVGHARQCDVTCPEIDTFFWKCSTHQLGKLIGATNNLSDYGEGISDKIKMEDYEKADYAGRKRQQDKLSRVENQLEVLSGKLTDVEGKQSNQATNLQRGIKPVKIDNSKLVRTLQDTLELNEQLRAQVALLEETLCKQKVECDKLNAQSKDIESKLRQQDSSYAARIAELEAQLSQEWDKASQHVQVKSSERAELSRKNDELKLKVKSLKADVCKLKGEIKHKAQKIHKLQEIKKEVKRLYTSNEKLSFRCRDQEKTIRKIVSQFKEVQSKMRKLATLHPEQTEMCPCSCSQRLLFYRLPLVTDIPYWWLPKTHLSLEETKRLLDAEKMRCDELRRKYHECKKEVASLQELLRATELKLVEANNDTQIATETLEDTNRYFEERFSALSGELCSAKKQHLDLEWKNMDKQHRLLIERQRADETTSS